MALTHNGTKVNISDGELPTGYTKPTVTEFTDHENKYNARQFTVAKAAVENADAATTFAALVAQLNTDIEALLNADFDTTVLTVTSYAVLTVVKTNNSLSGILYTTGALSYVCTVTVFVKTA